MDTKITIFFWGLGGRIGGDQRKTGVVVHFEGVCGCEGTWQDVGCVVGNDSRGGRGGCSRNVAGRGERAA